MRKIFGYIIAVIIVASLFAAMAYQGIRTRNFEKQLFSAARSGDQKEIGYLISHRTPLNIVDERGYTPLLVAVSGAKYFAAEALFRGGALRNIKTPDGKSVVDLTLESTAPVVEKAKMLMTISEYYGIREEKKKMWGIAYCYGMQSGDILLSKHALGNGGDMNVHTPIDGTTPLMETCLARREDFIERLLKKKADPNLVDAKGKTCLQIAIENSLVKTVERLLAAGADPRAGKVDCISLANSLAKSQPTGQHIAIADLLKSPRKQKPIVHSN